MEDTVKKLGYLVGAGGLILIGLAILVGIIKLTAMLVSILVPAIFVGGGVYLGYRWWQNRQLGSGERSDRWS